MGQSLNCGLQLISIGASWQHLLEMQMTGLCPRAAESDFLGRGLGKGHVQQVSRAVSGALECESHHSCLGKALPSACCAWAVRA